MEWIAIVIFNFFLSSASFCYSFVCPVSIDTLNGLFIIFFVLLSNSYVSVQ